MPCKSNASDRIEDIFRSRLIHEVLVKVFFCQSVQLASIQDTGGLTDCVSGTSSTLSSSEPIAPKLQHNEVVDRSKIKLKCR